ncbi:MAG: PfkB family carbohydrate kinase [Saprospiraceae bacterium]|nr:PfkB family carbohydrate kinase [Saprospiraceae bacterium]
MSLLTVGTVAFDSIETPFGKAERIVGGAATFIGLSASYFVDQVNVVSVIGDDFPKEVLQDMEKRGINLEGLQVKEGEKSFFWEGKYHNNMNSRDTLDTQLNVLENFDPVLPDAYKSPSFLMLGNLTPAVQMRVLEQLESKPKLTVMDTMNFWMDIAWDELLEVIKKVDVLMINDEEARQLSKEYSLVSAAKKILTMGPEYLVIKKGEHGALLFHKDEIFSAPALPLETVYDPTGAGDTFAGGFTGYLAKCQEVDFEKMKSAIIYGSAMASFTVEKFGIERLAELTKDEVQERVDQFVKLASFTV